MMKWQEEKELKEKNAKLDDEYFSLQEKSNFAKELARLCRASGTYTASALRVEKYEEQEEQDKKRQQELKEELLIDEVDFYSAFVSFVKKFSSESSRVHSEMGSKTSELKKKTSAENGKLGGRPRTLGARTLN
ncbi:MAG TPA: hypothetical protein PK505_07300 [Treponemataceae bacterium]|jgi:hypothetical protein|nr:hypothetical protein [Treponemataceae bacterium]